MRSCAYCGKELAPGERCDCRMSTAKSNTEPNQTTNNNTNNSNDENKYSGWQENTYRTGYTKKEKKSFKNIFKRKKNNYYNKDTFKSAANNVSGFTKRFIHDPASTVANPGNLTSIQIIMIILMTAIAVSLCVFFCTTRMLPQTTLLGIRYGITDLLKYTLSGTISLSILLVVYLFTMHLISKFMMKSNIRFGTFIHRPVAAFIPLMIFSVLGFLISFFSIYATVMLVLVGIIMWIILTYEAMRSEWSYASPNKVMYSIAIGFFIFFTIVFNILRVL